MLHRRVEGALGEKGGGGLRHAFLQQVFLHLPAHDGHRIGRAAQHEGHQSQRAFAQRRIGHQPFGHRAFVRAKADDARGVRVGRALHQRIQGRVHRPSGAQQFGRIERRRRQRQVHPFHARQEAREIGGDVIGQFRRITGKCA